MSDEVLRGPLGVHKKKGIEERYFVLHRERLDYFGSPADLEAGTPPRGHVDLAEVASLDTTQEDLVIHLQSGSQLCVRPPGEAALRSWSEALRSLSGAPAVAPEAEELGEGPPGPAGASGVAPEGAPSAEAAPGAEAAPDAEAGGAGAPDGAGGGPAERGPAGSASPEALCHGPLTVQRKGGFVLKYFVLREGSLTYFQRREDWEAGADPRGVCALPDVVALEDCDGGGFLLRLARPLSPLTLHAPTQQDLKMWVRELSALLAPQIGLGAIEHRELQEGARHGGGAGPQAPFFEGELLHVKCKKTELKYFVLLHNCFEYFNGQEEFAKGGMPRGQVALSDVQLVTVGDQGFCVDLGERRFVLEVVGLNPGETVEGWGEAWEQVLLAAPRRATCSGVHVRWERPRPRGTRAPPARPDGGAAPEGLQGAASREAGAAGAAAAAPPPPVPPAAAPAPPPAPPSQARAAAQARAAEPEPGRAPDPAADPVGAIQALLQQRNLRVADLFQASHCRRPSSAESAEHLFLDEHGLREVCGSVGLELSAEESLKVLQAFDTAGRGRVDIGDLEAALRKYHRSRAHSVHGPRPSVAGHRARLQLAEKAKARLRSAGYGCGGVCWSRVFEHHARRDGRGIDLPGFVSMVRRDVKISYREMPDALLEQVFATVNTSGTGGIGFPEFLEWLGVQRDADRERREEQAAIKIQALMRGQKARKSVHTLKAQGPQVLRRGTFTVELRDGTTEKWMVIVYENRMECFGARHGHRILAGDIEDVEVSGRCFLMDVRGGVKLSLRCPDGACMEEWMDAFSRLGAGPPAPAPAKADSEDEVPWSSEDDEPSASMASMVSTAASAACTPQAGGSPLSPCGRGWRPGGPVPCAKPSPLAEARAAPARASRDELLELLRRSPGMAGFLGLPPCTPEQLEAGLGRLAADGRRELSLAEVAALFGGADPSTPSRAAGSPCRPERSPKGPSCSRGAAPAGSPRPAAAPKAKASDRPWTVSPELLAGVPEPQLQEWLSSLRDAPVHAGLLGFHEHGQVAMRCGVLFGDRLDSWDSAADALGGHLPRGRVMLRDIHCIEMRGGGFVLKCQARRVALSLPAGGDARAWLGPLHGLLPGRLPAAGAACGRPAPAARRRSRSASVKCFVPRCASLVPTPRSREASPRVTLAGSKCHLAQRDGIRINTHSGGLQAGLLLHGAEALMRPEQSRAVSAKVNERVGALSARAEVCGKITGERQPSLGRAQAGPPSAKITGDRQRSLTPRRAGAEVCGKITGERRAATPERAAGCRLAAKVTERGRDSSLARARSASPVAAKITDAGRTSVGWARQPAVPLVDRMRPLGAPLSGAQGGALMTARILF